MLAELNLSVGDSDIVALAIALDVQIDFFVYMSAFFNEDL